MEEEEAGEGERQVELLLEEKLVTKRTKVRIDFWERQ